MATISEYLNQNVAGVIHTLVGVWVRLSNNKTSSTYVSTAVTDGNGLFTVLNVPAGLYTVATGPSNTGPWTNTGDNSFNVPDEPLWLNVKDYGAKGDGVTDDFTAITAAQAASVSSGGALFFPTGNYLVSDYILINNGTKWLGQGIPSVIGTVSGTVITATGANKGVVKFRPGTPGNNSPTSGGNVFMQGICFNGGSTTGHLVTIARLTHVTFSDCSFNNTTGTGLKDDNATSIAGAGLYAYGVEILRFYGCHFENNISATGNGGSGLAFENSVHMVTVSGCHFNGNVSALRMIGNDNGTIKFTACDFNAGTQVIFSDAGGWYNLSLDTCWAESQTQVTGSIVNTSGAANNTNLVVKNCNLIGAGTRTAFFLNSLDGGEFTNNRFNNWSVVYRASLGSSGTFYTEANNNYLSVTNVFNTAAVQLMFTQLEQGNIHVKGGSPWFDVKAFGAKGDGGVDDTVAIQAAITAASVGGGIVFFPIGSYRISAALTIPNNQAKAIRLIGAGKDTTSIFQVTASTDTLQIGTLTRCDISDMTLTLPAAGSTGNVISGGVTNTTGWQYSTLARCRLLNADSTHWAVKVTNPFSLQFQDLEIRNCGNGIDFINDSTTINYGNSKLDHLEIVLPASIAGTALKFESLTSKIMNLNTVTRLDITVISGSAGYVVGSTGVFLSGAFHNYFYGCDMEMVDHGIRLVNSTDNHFQGFYIGASGQTTGAVNLDANCRGNTFERLFINNVIGAANNTCIADLNASTTQPDSFAYVQTNDTWASSNLSVTSVTRLYAVLLANVLQTNVAGHAWRELIVKNLGAGTNPQFSSNSGSQNLDLTGLSLRPVTDNVGQLGDATHRWNLFVGAGLRILAASGDSRGTLELLTGQLGLGVGGSTAPDRLLTRSATGWTFTGGTISSDGDPGLSFTTAISRVIPGATSLSLRNNANSADNLIITDAGATTLRAGLTISASGATITGASTITADASALTLASVTGSTATRISFKDQSTEKWLVGKESDNRFFVWDSANSRYALSVRTTGITVDINGLTMTSGPVIGALSTDAFSGAITITVDGTKGNTHKIAATSNTASTLTPSAAGVAGQHMWIIITADGTGGNVITFASTFKPSGTLTTTASKGHTVHFISDGTNWWEVSRTLAL